MAFDEQIPEIHQALHENWTCVAVAVRAGRKQIQNSVKCLGCLQIIKKPEYFESRWKRGQFKKRKKEEIEFSVSKSTFNFRLTVKNDLQVLLESLCHVLKLYYQILAQRCADVPVILF